ncbi:hypothetical protein CDD80_3084 [Ophiocordyceps camponoti-rufipedis]|uniref:Mitochondrial import receptor subunit tom-22 n=1 Tax=Ophiocordyceps camponoti-rufipedis TaxID=2004952 RepID=A0A2C5Z3J2_9HYPO|nr:hypothetical protein CDD80_3084 [Ophiocordyceps camponoti-rufipedis]
MVTLTEVEDEHFHDQTGDEINDDDFTDTDSEISNESDYEPTGESFAERLLALRDVIPPTTRGWVSNHVTSFSTKAWSILSFSGKGAWVITTSALFFGVPFALSFAEDQQIMAMDQEMSMRQTGNDLMTAEPEKSADEKAAAVGTVDVTTQH